MSRRRYISTDLSVDPGFQDLAAAGDYLPPLLWLMAIPHADDYGRLTGDARQFRLAVCPGFEVTTEQVEAALEAISVAGLWQRYAVDGQRVIQFKRRSFNQYQTYIQASKRESAEGGDYPAPPEVVDSTGHRKTPQNAANPRESAEIAGDCRGPAQKAASPSPSPSPSEEPHPLTPSPEDDAMRVHGEEREQIQRAIEQVFLDAGADSPSRSWVSKALDVGGAGEVHAALSAIGKADPSFLRRRPQEILNRLRRIAAGREPIPEPARQTTLEQQLAEADAESRRRAREARG